MASNTIALVDIAPTSASAGKSRSPLIGRFSHIDSWFLAGLLGALGAVAAGIAITGVSLAYFVQPAAASIVLGGTLGVTLITTPRAALISALRRAAGLWRAREWDRVWLLEELMNCGRARRKSGVLGLKPLAEKTTHPLLKDMLALVLDTQDRGELQAALETRIKLRERRGEADARVLETMGGFAPTIGVLGTVVGLIDVLRQFSQPALIAQGIGTAFVSTIYGLSLANLVLLPAAGRIRANTIDTFETEEMIAEGGLGLLDGIHLAVLRDRLTGYLRPAHATTDQNK